jgi:hypothetical protein
MNTEVFDLVYSDYEWQEHYFISAPKGMTPDDFKKLCESLLPQAGYHAALKRSSPNVGGWISWRDVMEALVSLLEKQGYQQIELGSYNISGGIIINPADNVKLGFSGRIIAEHNQKIEKKVAEERKAKKHLRLGLLKKKVVQIIK